MTLPINHAEGFWILLLLLTWAEFLFGGLLTGAPNEDNTRRMPVWTRMMASTTLVIVSWFWVFFAIGKTIDGTFTLDSLNDIDGMVIFAFLMAMGMTCGLIGDIYMAEQLPASNHVLNGMISFGIGHIFYIVGLLYFGFFNNLDNTTSLIGSLIVWWIIALISWYIVVYQPAQSKTALHIVALPYSLLLASTTAVATGFALQSIEFIPIALGASLFLLSDLILAGQIFSGFSFSYIGDTVWLTYSPGQMLIVITIPMLSVLQNILY